MAHKRITMQQLADACGLSRNTVSKIFNDHGSVPESTRQTVLQKAKEIGYYRPFEEEPSRVELPKLQNIALLTRKIPIPSDVHFGTFFLPAFTERLSRAGYMLAMYEITPEEIQTLALPAHMVLEQTTGISVIEMFDPRYLDMLCSLGLPCITVDTHANANLFPMKCDLISMENNAGITAVTEHVIAAGAKRLGFIGDPEHCESFRQRWAGFSAALERAGLPLDRSICILEKDSPLYSSEDWLLKQIERMPARPDALICANDYLALHVMNALKRMGLGIPGDVMVTGFDGIPQSAVVEPSLTTVQIPSMDIGRMAADLLLSRLENPGSPFHATYVQTTPVWRNSTAR